MKNNVKFINKILFLVIFSINFISCDPATGISITNRTNYDIYIEYSFNSELNIEEYFNNLIYGFIENNIKIKRGENGTIIYMGGTRILEHLGFEQIRNDDDIINAINLLFNEISVYCIINSENILIYNKDYFLQKNSFKKRNYPISYSLEFIIR